jgi:transposase
MTTEQQDTFGAGRGGRMSRQRKRDAVLRPLRGEDLDTVSRSLGVTSSTAARPAWRANL